MRTEASTKRTRSRASVAIVGVGGIFPDAPTLDAFWDNVASRACAAREVPDGRWLLDKADVFDAERGRPDKVYSLKACLVQGFSLDPAGLALHPALLSRLDPVFHLALHAARQAFLDAKTESLDRSRVGVAIGNIVLPTDSSSALTRELLMPEFEERALGRRLSPRGLSTEPLNRYPAGLPAGLISKALGLGGGAFTLDAACASSLYALKLAVDELQSFRADAMLTGGVSRPESLYTQMGFSQLRALSARGTPSPFDAAADGLVVGEGAGLFLLKRLDDALRDGDKVYGVIAGIGLSNDVGGSLLAPNTVGQLRAMRQAYEGAGWSPPDVDYIECHATGTPTGDPIEVASLKALWGERGWAAGQCALGSVKSNIGHLLTAAGSAGLMKTLLAFQREQLPPTANFVKESPQLALAESPFRVQTKLEPWRRRKSAPRRAAVSAFGFGGINAHVLVEEFVASPARRKTAARPRPANASAPVAIVGMEARYGSLAGLREFQERLLSTAEPPPPASPEGRWWGLPAAASRKAHLLGDVSVSAKKYRIPPKELEEMLPQQMLMLDVAAAALGDARLPEAGRDRCGVFIGLGLDLNTTNFHFRWALLAKAREWAKLNGWAPTPAQEAELVERLRAAAGPALSANRTMGALGGIVASRIAREFSIGGPSFTLSSEDTSGLRALETAVRSLQQGELDSAIVGAVDVHGDARSLLAAEACRAAGRLAGEGAAALVLKRLDDALRDGDRVYAVLRGVGAASGASLASACGGAMRRAYAEAGVDPSTIGFVELHGSGRPDEDAAEAEALVDFFGTAKAELPIALGLSKAQVGDAGAAGGLASVVRASLALYQEILPAAPAFEPPAALARAHRRFHAPARPQFWLRNRAEGPRRAGVTALSVDGTAAHVVLEAVERLEPNALVALERRQPLGARGEALFVVEADEPRALVEQLAALRVWAAEQNAGANIERLARERLAAAPRAERDAPRPKRAVALVARSAAELAELCASAEASLRENPDRPVSGDRIHVTTREPFGEGSIAFVFPGSGNQYVGMGFDVGVQWPEIPRRLDAENGHLRRQMVPELYAPWRLRWTPGWESEAESELLSDYKSMIFGSVAHGTVMSDLVRSFGVEPSAVIGYSLGETAGLFSLRAWTDRDEMLRRMNESSLFVSDLAGPCDAARQFWNLPTDERVEWVLGVIDRPASTVKRALKAGERAALLIVNAPLECVVGGYKKAVESLVEGLGCVFLPLRGVSTVHFPAAKLVEKQYRELHLLPTRPPQGVRFYSGAWGRSYDVSRESAADSITAQAVRSFDFSALVKRAYDDGVRIFVELGPQGSCSRMIGKILGPLPHVARSACQRGQDGVSTVLRLLAQLCAERAPVDLRALYGQPTLCVGHRQPQPPEPRVSATLGGAPFTRVQWKPTAAAAPDAPSTAALDGGRKIAAVPLAHERAVAQSPGTAPVLPPSATATRAERALIAEPAASAFVAAQSMTARAHEAFLRLQRSFAENQARNLARFGAAAPSADDRGRPPSSAVAAPRSAPPRSHAREQCLEFAVGRIGKVLGERFSHVDAYPTRVRLPGEPLMLVDRITEIEGEPNSLKSGRVVTEHDVLRDGWYLDCGRIPTCVAVEAGQADLFLSGFLGIDSQTKGLAVYRLLDAEVTFHGPLPTPGQVIRYDIHIDGFGQHEDTWLFFFRFESTVDGKPLLSMRKGCAGFFTQAMLASGKGIVLQQPLKGTLGAFKPLLPPDTGPVALTDEQVNSFRQGDISAAFNLPQKPPFAKTCGLPSGKMKLVDRVVTLDPANGYIKAEADIRPDDWHLVCHFTDDNVMPGTLMYECCLHTMRILLARLGLAGEEGKVWYEPKPGVSSQLKCRGQVLASTKKVHYEIFLKDVGYEGGDGAPYAIADALMYSDGKPIVHITDMSLRIGGADRRSVESLWSVEAPAPKRVLFDRDKITAFAIGDPSEAFGEPYKVFDKDRVIARLPGPPYQFLDRIVDIKGCEPFKLAAGGSIVAEYDVPKDEWYFAANGQPTMPFAVLLEVALQPCGWLAAYLGSALTSPIDLSFRNLGGTATQFIDVTPEIGTLSTHVKITKVAQSGGMIIQNFEYELWSAKGLVYNGSTEFGFFTKAALSQQVGVRGAKVYQPSAPGRPLDPKSFAGMPDERLLLLDEVEVGDLWLKGWRKVNPSEWFFKAHFYQDPVCPGSLGLESFIELMKIYARERWGPGGRFESMGIGRPHRWLYRGQYTPVNKQVELSCVITKLDDARRELFADGHLSVDGLTIYQMKDFSLRLA